MKLRGVAASLCRGADTATQRRGYSLVSSVNALRLLGVVPLCNRGAADEAGVFVYCQARGFDIAL